MSDNMTENSSDSKVGIPACISSNSIKRSLEHSGLLAKYT